MAEFKIIGKTFTEPPVPGAFQRLTTVTDVRTVDDPAKLQYRPQLWYNWGTNHRVVKNHICRDLGQQLIWFVEIPDPIAFVREHGACTFSVDFFDQPRVRILALIEDDDL